MQLTRELPPILVDYMLVALLANNSGTVQNNAWLSGTAGYGVGRTENAEGVTKIENQSALDVIVWSLSASIDTHSVDTGETAIITFFTSPASASSLDGVFDPTTGAVRGNGVNIDCDTSVATAVYNNDGTITVTGQSEGETTITVKVTLRATDFSTLGASPSYLDEGTELTFTLTVHGDPATSAEESETPKTLGPGGCNAGIGALALLALIPLALRRKR